MVGEDIRYASYCGCCIVRSPNEIDSCFLRAEDTTGPLTTVDITTFEPEPQLELPFDDDAR